MKSVVFCGTPFGQAISERDALRYMGAPYAANAVYMISVLNRA
ncbi:MAG: hypothetical protein ACE5KA_06020 [Nitrososphaerales archaeon]